MYIYLQTHQVLYTKYIQPFVFQLYVNKVAEKNSLKMRPPICVYQALQVILVHAEAWEQYYTAKDILPCDPVIKLPGIW